MYKHPHITILLLFTVCYIKFENQIVYLAHLFSTYTIHVHTQLRMTSTNDKIVTIDTVDKETKYEPETKTKNDNKVRFIVITPIRVDKLSGEEKTKYNLTEDASAEFFVGGDVYDVPKEGCRFELKTPVDAKDLIKIRVSLYMYGRQPHNGYYYTVSMPHGSDVVIRDETISLTFIQNSFGGIVFNLHDTQKLKTFLTKKHTDKEIGSYLPWWQDILNNKEEYLTGLDTCFCGSCECETCK
jgi:hypothetical protein